MRDLILNNKAFMFFYIVMCLGIYAYGQTAEETFEKANQAYNNGLFQEAIQGYEAILSEGKQSEVLYYNLGNSYYQLKRVGPAVYYYEKALWINPNYADAQYNLSFAENMKIDAIEPLPQTQLQKYHRKILRMFSLNSWAILSLIFVWGTLLFFGLFRYVQHSRSKRVYFGLSILSLILSLNGLYFSWQSDISRYSPSYAILWDTKVQVQSEPNQRSEFLFEIHEGTKVQVLDALESWQQIQLANGSVGWVKNAQLVVINPKP